jgi:acetyl esterase/lipase
MERLVERYGDEPLQLGEWWVPTGLGPLPTVVLVHGGYWGPQYDRHLEDAVAEDLALRGYLVWNVDYRAADAVWPATLLDVAAAYDHIGIGAFADRVDSSRQCVVGHSAGGQLALWLGSRGPEGPFARAPRIAAPALVVAQAPVAALVDGARLRLDDGAVQTWLGGEPEEVPDRYAHADPVALLPSGTTTVLVHSEEDALVPISQSRRYVAAAREAGDRSTLVVTAGDHFAHLDPGSAACEQLRAALSSLS